MKTKLLTFALIFLLLLMGSKILPAQANAQSEKSLGIPNISSGNLYEFYFSPDKPPEKYTVIDKDIKYYPWIKVRDQKGFTFQLNLNSIWIIK